MWNLFGTRTQKARPYYPQARGAVERHNRTLKTTIFKYKDSDPTGQWVIHFNRTILQHNSRGMFQKSPILNIKLIGNLYSKPFVWLCTIYSFDWSNANIVSD